MMAENSRDITLSETNAAFMLNTKRSTATLCTFLLLSIRSFVPAHSQALSGDNQAKGDTRIIKKLPDSPKSSSPIFLNRIEVRANPDIAEGCWVWLFPEPTYTGTDSVAIAGPTELIPVYLSSVFLTAHEIKSIKVGPKATLTTYENSVPQSAIRRFKPGSNTQWIREGKKLHKSINYIKISCAP